MTKNENVCGQVQKAHKDKSDKGFYFQDLKKDWSEDSESDLKFNESIGSSYSCNLSDRSKYSCRSKNVFYGQPLI